MGYREIADSLRVRIRGGEFPVGAKLPGISALQAEYGGPALNTVRAAQQVLVDEGMLVTRRGMGAFVTSTETVEQLDVVATLRQADAALSTAIAALQASGHPAAAGRAVPGGADPAAGSGSAGDPAGSTDRRTRLLAAACRVIARRGVRGLRVDEVADDAGVSTALIYHHFGNRSGLVTHAMQHINDRLSLRAGTSAGGSGMQRLLRRMVSEFGEDEQTRENSAVWGEVRGAAVFDEELRPIMSSATEHWIEQLAQLITAGGTDGSIAADADPWHVALRLTAMVEGLSNRWLAGLLSTEQAREEITATVRAELAG